MAKDISLRQSIKAFLAAESRNIPAEQRCENCDSVMESLVATFTLGDGESWDVAMPYCAVCEEVRFSVSKRHYA
jgi:hypothetical protein